MAKLLKPLSSTIRVVEWEDMPAPVRAVPDDFDPLAEGVLMKHQVLYLRIVAAIKGCRKARRTGITFASALGKTIKAASRKSAGGGNVYYIGDTKEKGLEYIGYVAKFAQVIARAQGQGLSGVEEFLFEDQDQDGRSKHITSYRIRFASGFQVVALSSRPANIRGLQGDVVIDEAAFHPDVQGVLDAVMALLIWGGSVEVISSENGKMNPFHQFCTDIEAGKYGEDAVVFTVTFDDAVANGLYERTEMMRGRTPTAEGKRKWYERIRNAYGPRKAAMREELDCIPRDGGGLLLPGIWIERAMTEERPVLRLALADDFAVLPGMERERYVAEWIERELQPVLNALLPGFAYVVSMDFARHRHFSVISPLFVGAALKRICPFGVEMHNVPTRQQEQILWHIIDHLIGMGVWRAAAIDAGGPGQTLAEYTADRYGHSRVHQVQFSRAWYREWMRPFIDSFETGMIDLPRDTSWADDLRTIEDVDGVPMIPSAERKDLKDPDLYRHGDSVPALALGWFATCNMSSPIEFTAPPKTPRGFGGAGGGGNRMRMRANDLDDLPLEETGTSW